MLYVQPAVLIDGLLLTVVRAAYDCSIPFNAIKNIDFELDKPKSTGYNEILVMLRYFK